MNIPDKLVQIKGIDLARRFGATDNAPAARAALVKITTVLKAAIPLVVINIQRQSSKLALSVMGVAARPDQYMQTILDRTQDRGPQWPSHG